MAEHDSVEMAEYERNNSGLIFYLIFMFVVLLSVLYVSDVSLGIFAPYEKPIYTVFCAITLAAIPVTLVLTFAPFGTPLAELAIAYYSLHLGMTLLIFFLLITDYPFYHILALLMITVDLLMVFSICTRSSSTVLVTLRPFKKVNRDSSNVASPLTVQTI